jgi:ribose 1,5-bisphosphokinase
VITRPADPGSEDHLPASVAEFAAMAERGAFCVHWGAHDLFYGIPAEVAAHTAAGTDCLANFSRGALDAAAAVFPRVVVLNLTARPDTLARRLAGRGRETATEIAARLARKGSPIPTGLPVVSVSNDGPLEDTVARALAALQPVRA